MTVKAYPKSKAVKRGRHEQATVVVAKTEKKAKKETMATTEKACGLCREIYKSVPEEPGCVGCFGDRCDDCVHMCMNDDCKSLICGNCKPKYRCKTCGAPLCSEHTVCSGCERRAVATATATKKTKKASEVKEKKKELRSCTNCSGVATLVQKCATLGCHYYACEDCADWEHNPDWKCPFCYNRSSCHSCGCKITTELQSCSTMIEPGWCPVVTCVECSGGDAIDRKWNCKEHQESEKPSLPDIAKCRKCGTESAAYPRLPCDVCRRREETAASSAAIAASSSSSSAAIEVEEKTHTKEVFDVACGTCHAASALDAKRTVRKCYSCSGFLCTRCAYRCEHSDGGCASIQCSKCCNKQRSLCIGCEAEFVCGGHTKDPLCSVCHKEEVARPGSTKEKKRCTLCTLKVTGRGQKCDICYSHGRCAGCSDSCPEDMCDNTVCKSCRPNNHCSTCRIPMCFFHGDRCSQCKSSSSSSAAGVATITHFADGRPKPMGADVMVAVWKEMENKKKFAPHQMGRRSAPKKETIPVDGCVRCLKAPALTNTTMCLECWRDRQSKMEAAASSSSSAAVKPQECEAYGSCRKIAIKQLVRLNDAKIWLCADHVSMHQTSNVWIPGDEKVEPAPVKLPSISPTGMSYWCQGGVKGRTRVCSLCKTRNCPCSICIEYCDADDCRQVVCKACTKSAGCISCGIGVYCNAHLGSCPRCSASSSSSSSSSALAAAGMTHVCDYCKKLPSTTVVGVWRLCGPCFLARRSTAKTKVPECEAYGSCREPGVVTIARSDGTNVHVCLKHTETEKKKPPPPYRIPSRRDRCIGCDKGRSICRTLTECPCCEDKFVCDRCAETCQFSGVCAHVRCTECKADGISTCIHCKEKFVCGNHVSDPICMTCFETSKKRLIAQTVVRGVLCEKVPNEEKLIEEELKRMDKEEEKKKPAPVTIIDAMIARGDVSVVGDADKCATIKCTNRTASDTLKCKFCRRGYCFRCMTGCAAAVCDGLICDGCVPKIKGSFDCTRCGATMCSNHMERVCDECDPDGAIMKANPPPKKKLAKRIGASKKKKTKSAPTECACCHMEGTGKKHACKTCGHKVCGGCWGKCEFEDGCKRSICHDCTRCTGHIGMK